MAGQEVVCDEMEVVTHDDQETVSEAVVRGGQGMAGEEVVVIGEVELVACVEERTVSDTGVCADPQMVSRDELWTELVQLHGVGAPMCCDRSLARPATTHFVGSFDARVHCASSLGPWRMHLDPGQV